MWQIVGLKKTIVLWTTYEKNKELDILKQREDSPNIFLNWLILKFSCKISLSGVHTPL